MLKNDIVLFDIPVKPREPFFFMLRIQENSGWHYIRTDFSVNSSDPSLMDAHSPDGIRKITAFLRRFCDDLEAKITPKTDNQ